MAANKKLTKEGYGQLELNQVSFRRDGRVEAQCALETSEFASTVAEEASKAPCENGMLLAIDQINRKVKLPASGTKMPIALNYTTEHMYDKRADALKDYATRPGSFYPRLGYLSIGEKFTTNMVCWDSAALSIATESALDSAFVQATLTSNPLYGVVCTDSDYEGYISLVNAVPSAPVGGIVLQAAQKTTMPDGQKGIRFVVIKA